jgi:hypothetical protein
VSKYQGIFNGNNAMSLLKLVTARISQPIERKAALLKTKWPYGIMAYGTLAKEKVKMIEETKRIRCSNCKIQEHVSSKKKKKKKKIIGKIKVQKVVKLVV